MSSAKRDNGARSLESLLWEAANILRGPVDSVRLQGLRVLAALSEADGKFVVAGDHCGQPFGHRVGVHGQLPAPIGEHVSPSVVAARAGGAVRGQLTSAGER